MDSVSWTVDRVWRVTVGQYGVSREVYGVSRAVGVSVEQWMVSVSKAVDMSVGQRMVSVEQ